LTESDLIRIIKKVIIEQSTSVGGMSPKQIDEQGGLMNLFSKFQLPRFSTNASPTTKQTPNALSRVNDRIADIAAMLISSQIKNVPTRVIINKDSKYNNKTLNQYYSEQKITQQEVNQARALLKQLGVKEGGTQPVQNQQPAQNQLLAAMQRNQTKKSQQVTGPKQTSTTPKGPTPPTPPVQNPQQVTGPTQKT